MEVTREDQRKGPSNIWIAQRVETETIGDILSQLKDSSLKEYLVSPDRLHTTLAWLKETRKFLRLLEKHCEELDRKAYQDKREGLIDDLTNMEGTDLEVPIKGLKYVGTSRRVVVLGLEHTKALKRSREPFVERIKGFLEDVGVRSPKKLMAGHPGLSSALLENYQPHVTVARGYQPVDIPFIHTRGRAVCLASPQTKYTPLDNHWHSY